MFIKKIKSAYSSIRINNFYRPSCLSINTLNQNLGKIIVGLPMALLIIYLTIFSHPRYLSESTIAIKSANSIDGNSLSVGLLLGAAGSSTATDAMYLQKYINSPDMLNILNHDLNFFQAFGSSGLDFLNHLSDKVTREELFSYYLQRVTANYDDKTGLMTIGTQGFTPEFAQQFNHAVLKESERFINEISHKIAREQQAFAEEEMHKAQARLNISKARMLAFQNQNNVLDPKAQALAAVTLVNMLVSQQIQLQADLRNLLTYLREDAPQVVSAKNAIASLGKQIEQEKSKITAPEGHKLNSMAVDFEEIKSQVAFDSDMYKLALTSIEKTRIESARKLKVLSVISSPQVPQETRFPNIPYLIASTLLVCCLLFGTIKLLLAIVDDHKD
ncbi:capsule biosynthesis protein [Rouxiella silvae]|uniref:Capsule biosynthesis protein n=1 Tax=Rouxiella silvae TaxID=1646373 RepID=A0ABX3TTT9_9GAMM|nr:capsule biosynthesis protein [Rouxiella silvae]ORJ18623.1 capsule biosynthesis protein [Rouxiella silvae]